MRPLLKSTLVLCSCLLLTACPQAKEGKETTEGEHSGKADEHHKQSPNKRPARTVRLSPAAIERAELQTARALSSSAVGGLSVPAEIEADPDRLAHVSSIVTGQIAEVLHSVGDQVKRGEKLAVIRSVALGQARAEAARADANVEVSRTNLRRQEDLKREGIGAERHFLEAQAALKRAQAEQSAAARALEVYGHGGSGSEVVLRSPIDGRVTARHATIGEVVESSETLFEVTDIARVWVIGRVYQQDAAQLEENAPAILTLQAHRGKTFSGELAYVSPTIDEATHALPIRMELDNPEGLLRPGLFGTLTIQPKGGQGENLPTVVRGAVQRIGNESVVFVVGEKPGEFIATAIEIASRSADLVQVAAGLSADTEYVSSGAFVLKSELQRGQLAEGHSH